MARPPLPRFATDVVITVEVAGTDLRDAYERVLELEGVIRRAVEPAVRNTGSRTARVTAVTADAGGYGPDCMAAV